MKTILIVEDEDELSSVVGSVLKDMGYGVHTSCSAEDGLQYCASSRPDLIICDIKMGKMDGFELLEHLKAVEATRTLPFVFLTAFDDSRSKKKGLELGADAYITKPFDLDDLLQTVARLQPPS
jgi:CheY-like chemotaxis protein